MGSMGSMGGMGTGRTGNNGNAYAFQGEGSHIALESGHRVPVCLSCLSVCLAGRLVG